MLSVLIAEIKKRITASTSVIQKKNKIMLNIQNAIHAVFIASWICMWNKNVAHLCGQSVDKVLLKQFSELWLHHTNVKKKEKFK